LSNLADKKNVGTHNCAAEIPLTICCAYFVTFRSGIGPSSKRWQSSSPSNNSDNRGYRPRIDVMDRQNIRMVKSTSSLSLLLKAGNTLLVG
jgi:hypothetical protein